MRTIFKKSKWQMAVFVAPTLILFSLIIIIPLIRTFFMSFTEWNGVTEATYNGIENYEKLFATTDFTISIRNSIIYSLFLVTYQTGLGTIFAFILTTFEIKGKKFFRDVYFFPVLLSVSVVAQLWVSIYHGDFGLINTLAQTLGFSWQQTWLSQEVKGIIAIVFADSWKGMGYHMLIIYAAMRNIPKMYYEASMIDGANKLQMLRFITLPLAAPSIRMSMVMCLTFGFRAFELIYLMTGGGPANYSTTLTIMMYKALFSLQKYGYGSAIAMVIVAISVGLMIIINKVGERFDVQY